MVSLVMVPLEHARHVSKLYTATLHHFLKVKREVGMA